MILCCDHNLTISESCQSPSDQHLMQASQLDISAVSFFFFFFQQFLFNSSSFRLHNWLLQLLGRREHKMKNCKYHHHVCIKPTARQSPEAGILRRDGCSPCCFQLSLHLQILHVLVHGHSVKWWMKFWWKKWKAHLNWAVMFCLFYSGFRHHNWSRHEVLQWFAQSDSRRIHFCASDAALYAGTGRWIHSEAFVPGG